MSGIHRVLCVDDEPLVLQALERNLRRVCPVVTMPSGAAALALLRKDRAFSVIISDMRMPEMNGARFLNEARLLAPDAVRILLTGEADLDAIIDAINDGNISQYLRKPVSRDALEEAVQAAFVSVSRVTEERERLQQSARGSLQLALEVIRGGAPKVVERGERITRLTMQLGDRLALSSLGALELTALGFTVAQVSSPAGRAALQLVLVDEVFAGARAAIAELLDDAPAERCSMMARVVRAAMTLDGLEQAGFDAITLELVREAKVEPRMLEAFRQARLDPGASQAA